MIPAMYTTNKGAGTEAVVLVVPYPVTETEIVDVTTTGQLVDDWSEPTVTTGVIVVSLCWALTNCPMRNTNSSMKSSAAWLMAGKPPPTTKKVSEV